MFKDAAKFSLLAGSTFTILHTHRVSLELLDLQDTQI